jgi:hypothetical protein
MYHKISDMIEKIDVIHFKAQKLKHEKYVVPERNRNPELIQYLIEDIQSLCREIANDKGVYEKKS